MVSSGAPHTSVCRCSLASVSGCQARPPVNANRLVGQAKRTVDKMLQQSNRRTQATLGFGFQNYTLVPSEAYTNLRKRRGKTAGLKLSLSPEDQEQGGIMG